MATATLQQVASDRQINDQIVPENMMVKAASYSSSDKKPKRGSKKKKKRKKVELPPQTILKQSSYSAETVALPIKKLNKSASYSSKNVLSDSMNGKKPIKTRRRGNTNKFMTTVNVGQTVKLTKDRIAFVRFKGRVKFGLGMWFGLEIYDSLTKTRHNGTVYGKRYFNCPRNKGLFVKRDVILDVIKPQNIRKLLQTLEQKQIKRKKLEKEREKKLAIRQRKDIGLTHNTSSNSILALYQKQVYGNNTLLLKLNNDNKRDDIENKIHKDFKRFKRLSFMASNNPEIVSMIHDDDIKKEFEEDIDNKDEDKDIDIDAEAWDSFKEKPIIELLDDVNDNEDDLCTVRLWHPLKSYLTAIEYVFNKGLLVKEIDHCSKQGRALILECGIQGNNGWYIMVINGDNIKKYSKNVVDDILDKLLPDIGYDITFKKD